MNKKLILLVEDEAYKREHISALVKEAFVCEIEAVRSVKSALDFIEEVLPTLMILDMSLPTYEIVDRERGGRPQGYGGREVLRFMEMEDFFVPTIVITGYDAFPDSGGSVGLETLTEELCEEFPVNLKAVLRYDSTSSGWRTELLNVISKLDVVSKNK